MHSTSLSHSQRQLASYCNRQSRTRLQILAARTGTTHLRDGEQGLCSRRCNVLLLGLEGAGKTTLLYKFKLGKAIETTPTFGFNLETIEYRDIEFKAWDIAGGDQNRLSVSWRSHIKRVDAVVFVVDASDGSRMYEAAQVLRGYFELQQLRDAKLLVLANKQDQLDCMPIKMIQETLNLESVTKSPHRIEKAVVVESEGIYEGLDWLCEAISGTL